jgi:hypothetical protein
MLTLEELETTVSSTLASYATCKKRAPYRAIRLIVHCDIGARSANRRYVLVTYDNKWSAPITTEYLDLDAAIAAYNDRLAACG